MNLRFGFVDCFRRCGSLKTLVLALGTLTFAVPVHAHHATGGRMPASAFEGFLSGLAHPILGLDHFAFVIAVGLVAAFYRNGSVIPLVFAAMSLAGTGLHLLALNLPTPEAIIAASVLVFGLLLARGKSAPMLAVTAFGAIAGLFHGYAYGESIVGAPMQPLLAYLAGFTVIQSVIALASYRIGRTALGEAVEGRSLGLRLAGVLVCCVGALFLTSALSG